MEDAADFSHQKRLETIEMNLTVYLPLFFSYIDNCDICVAASLLTFLLCTIILLNTNKWLGMIIYLVMILIYYLWFFYVIFWCWMFWQCFVWFIMLLCILLHSLLICRTFRTKRDFPRNTTRLGDFSYPIFLVFPNSMDRHNGRIEVAWDLVFMRK